MLFFLFVCSCLKFHAHNPFLFGIFTLCTINTSILLGHSNKTIQIFFFCLLPCYWPLFMNKIIYICFFFKYNPLSYFFFISTSPFFIYRHLSVAKNMDSSGQQGETQGSKMWTPWSQGNVCDYPSRNRHGFWSSLKKKKITTNKYINK